MQQQRADLFLVTNGNKFRPEHLDQVVQIINRLDDNKFQLLLSLDLKDPTIMLLISLSAGVLGIDRFILGETGLGIAKLLTAGGCGIWAIIDWFTIQDKTKDYNFQLLMQTLS